jgi:hypothetical protein
MVLIMGFGSVAMAKSPASANFGFLFYDGMTVRTVVPPAAMPKPGRDDFYAVMNGVEDQLGIAAVAPGDKDYHGGKWAFHSVMWNEEPYLLTSEADVLDAASAGEVTIMRLPQNDFKCPIQP